MILLINTSAGINLYRLTDFIIKKIQNLTFDGYRLIFSADNQEFHLYKTGIRKETKNYDAEYFSENYEEKITNVQNALDDLSKNIYFVHFIKSYANKLGSMDPEDLESELQLIETAYENRTCNNFIVCGILSKELIWELQAKYGKVNTQVLNLIRNPSSAFVYNDCFFYLNGIESKRVFSDETYFLINTFSNTHVYNKINFLNFVSTYYNVLDLESNGFYPTKIEHLANSTIKIGRFPVDFSLYFTKVNDYVFDFDQNPDYDQLESFNDLFLHFTHCSDRRLCDMFGLLKYKPLSETQLKENL